MYIAQPYPAEYPTWHVHWLSERVLEAMTSVEPPIAYIAPPIPFAYAPETLFDDNVHEVIVSVEPPPRYIAPPRAATPPLL